jgi:hypothetical protein
LALEKQDLGPVPLERELLVIYVEPLAGRLSECPAALSVGYMFIPSVHIKRAGEAADHHCLDAAPGAVVIFLVDKTDDGVALGDDQGERRHADPGVVLVDACEVLVY